jgi:hypothetical protein
MEGSGSKAISPSPRLLFPAFFALFHRFLARKQEKQKS